MVSGLFYDFFKEQETNPLVCSTTEPHNQSPHERTKKMQPSQQNNPGKESAVPNSDNDLQKDKNKNPDQQRDIHKSNPDSPQQKGDNCGC